MYLHNGCGIAFERAGLCSFGRNTVIFGVDNRSSSHKDNRKIIFLSEEPTDNINGSDHTYINLVLILIKKIQNFA